MQRLDSGMQRHVHSQLASWADEVKAEASRQVPVRTGYLKSTIYAKIREWTAEIGAEAAYALFVELGTKYMQAHPYLYPAVEQFLPRLEATITAAIKQARSEAEH